MDKRAGFDIPVGIDMEVRTSSSDASANKLAVVPEVHGEDRLRFAVFANLVIHELALLRRNHQIRNRIFADRHIGKQPHEFRAKRDHFIDIRFASDHFRVRARIAAGDTKRQFLSAQNLHGFYDRLVRSCASSGIGCLLEPFHADCRHKILHAQHLICKVFVNERSVGKRKECAVWMRGAQK